MPFSKRDIEKEILDKGYWIAVHRLAIQKWTIISLYIFIAFVYIFFFVHFGIYVFGYGEWERYIAGASRQQYNWGAIHEQYAPQELIYGDVQVFSLGENRYDFVIEVQNPNDQWGIENIEYQFSVPDSDIKVSKEAYILPGERRYFSVLGYQATRPIASAQYEVLDQNWKKVSYLPPLSWIYTVDPQFVNRRVVVENGHQVLLPATVDWSVQNGSTLSISTVNWQVALYSGERLVSLVELQRDKFPFLKEQKFDITISGAVPRVSQVQVIPLVNIFDPNFTYVGGDEE